MTTDEWREQLIMAASKHIPTSGQNTDILYRARLIVDEILAQFEHVGWGLRFHSEAPCQWYLTPRIDTSNKPNSGSNQPPVPPYEEVFVRALPPLDWQEPFK